MKNALLLIVVALGVLFLASCHKCYQCHNQCSVCSKSRHDTTLTIIVESQRLSEQYYVEYIDSLTLPNVGWTCHDTASNFTEQFCKQGTGDGGLSNEEAKGMICVQ